MSVSLSSTRRSAKYRPLSAALAVLIALMPLTVCSAASKSKATQVGTNVPGIKSIALFPTANDASADGQIAAQMLDSAVKLRINSGGAYQATSFSMFLPAIQRALNVDNTLTPSDVKPPITEPTAALKIAQIMGTDGFFLCEVDNYKDDPQTHAISITASGSLYFTSTGSAARTFAITGTATPQDATEGASAVLQRAVNNTATQIMENIGTVSVGGTSEVPNSHLGSSASARSGLLIVLAGILVGVVIHNVTAHSESGSSQSNTGSTASSGSSGPPPPP